MADGSYGIRKIDEESIALAATLIRRGELVVIPTDTVYGLGVAVEAARSDWGAPPAPRAEALIFAADRAVAEYADNIWHVPHR